MQRSNTHANMRRVLPGDGGRRERERERERKTTTTKKKKKKKKKFRLDSNEFSFICAGYKRNASYNLRCLLQGHCHAITNEIPSVS